MRRSLFEFAIVTAGSKIAQRTFADRNLPHASSLALMLAVGILVPSIASIALNRRRESPALRQAGTGV